ncbi:hypothetical protein D3C81_1387460 [compost metagenome]
MAAHIQAGIATEQVEAVLDAVFLRDLDVAVVLAGRLKREGGDLVVTTGLVIDGDHDALVLLAFGDLPAALAQRAVLGAVIHAGALAGVRTAELQFHALIAQYQRVPVLESAQAVDRVIHDRHLAVGFDAFRNMALAGQAHANDDEQASHDPQGNQELDNTGHSRVSVADPTAGLIEAKPPS